jgi:hypothetical protein
MTYRELINSVLRRLREDTITADWVGDLYDTSTVTDYQKLVGVLINDSMQSVGQYHNWNTLRESFSLTTTPGSMGYILGDTVRGAGNSFQILDVINQDTGTVLTQAPSSWLNKVSFPSEEAENGEPTFYGLNGTTQVSIYRSPDFNIDLYPIPTKSEVISVNIVKQQEEMRLATESIKVPSLPVILGAWARAIAERGEDGGTISSAVAAEAREALVLSVQLDASNMEYERDWQVT